MSQIKREKVPFFEGFPYLCQCLPEQHFFKGTVLLEFYDVSG